MSHTYSMWLYDGDSLKMLVAESLFDIFRVKIGHLHLKSVINITKLSSTQAVWNNDLAGNSLEFGEDCI